MATIERTQAPVKPRRVGWLGVGAISAVGLVWLIVSLSRPPQMGPSDETFHAVEALFTAVGARDARLLGQCEQRLHELAAAGKLPTDAAGYLAGVIAKSRRGRWESAAETLYGFMMAQRRDGAGEMPAKPPRKVTDRKTGSPRRQP